MIETLAVHCDYLAEAGNKLAALVLPTPRPAAAAGGIDPVSAAINTTLPGLEAPVTEKLPAIQAAVTKTGSSFVAAAKMYTDADQTLGSNLTRVRCVGAADESVQVGASEPAAVTAAYGRLAYPEASDAWAAAASRPSWQRGDIGEGGARLGQVASAAGYGAQSVAQPVQAVMAGVPTGNSAQRQYGADPSTGDEQARTA